MKSATDVRVGDYEVIPDMSEAELSIFHQETRDNDLATMVAQEGKRTMSMDEFKRIMRPGMVLVVRGKILSGAESEEDASVLEKGNDLPYLGHAVIVAPDNERIVEAVTGDGVIMKKKALDWIRQYDWVAVVWGRGKATNDGRKVAAWAEKQIGKPYNYNFPTGKYQTDKYYCSSLCWNAWDLVKINLDKKVPAKFLKPFVTPIELTTGQHSEYAYNVAGNG